MSERWKKIAPRNCGAEGYAVGEFYVLPGAFMVELRQMAALLSSGEKINADERRDMGQRIQSTLDLWRPLKATNMVESDERE